MQWKAFPILLLALSVFGCSGQDCPPASQGVTAGTSNEFYTAKSAQEFVTIPGVKVTSIQGQDGRPHSIALLARDNNNLQIMKCGCTGGCDANLCQTDRRDNTVTTINCSGSCVGSEGLGCGGCSWYETTGWRTRRASK
jgi:hypothetical protein